MTIHSHIATSSVACSITILEYLSLEHDMENTFDFCRDEYLLTKTVSTIPTVSTEYQGIASLFSMIRCLIMRKILIQNAIAGPATRNVDKNKDATSGPKINLPPHKNFWNSQKNISFNKCLI